PRAAAGRAGGARGKRGGVCRGGAVHQSALLLALTGGARDHLLLFADEALHRVLALLSPPRALRRAGWRMARGAWALRFCAARPRARRAPLGRGIRPYLRDAGL